MKKSVLLATIATAVSAFTLAGFIGCTDDPPQEEPPQKTALAAPVITLTDNVVEWNAVEHAVSYSVYVGSDNAVTVTATAYTVEKTEPGAYEICVVANASSSGDYADSEKSNKVTYEVFSPEEIALVKLRLVNNPDKVDYFLDEVGGQTGLDLTGLAVNALYSNGSVKKVTPTVGNVDLTASGDKTVTLSYTEDGRTVQTTFVVTVRRRTEDDIENLVTLKHEFTGAGDYKVADGAVSVVDMDGESVPTTSADGVTKIAFQKSGVQLVKVINGAGDVSFVKVCAAIFVTNTADFLAMNDNLDGYYLLRNDINFGGSGSPIGVAPLRAANAGEFADERAYTYDESGAVRQGKAFTGTFDGDGYVIIDYRYECEGGRYADSVGYFLGMFGYIGEGGKVCNLVLRSSKVLGGKCCAIVAGVNLGAIENITIEEDCSLFAYYNGGAACAAYNGGKVENIVCMPDRFDSNWGGGAFVSAYQSSDSGTSRNVYIGNRSDLTGALGGGWFFIDGIGTIYCNESYKKVLEMPTTISNGQTAAVKVYQRTVQDVLFVTWVGGTATEGIVEYVSYESGTYTYSIRLSATSPLTAGDTFSLAIKPVGGDYLNSAVTVTVAAD